LQASSPKPGATLHRPPRTVSLSFTEAPAKGARARVVDGCRRALPAAVSVEGSDVVVALEGGRPGRWTVAYNAVSSVDGHRVRGKLTFRVSGAKRCGAEPDDEIAAGPNPGIVDNPDPPDETGASWIWWVAGGTILVAAAALLIRRST